MTTTFPCYMRGFQPRVVAALVCAITASGCATDPKTGQSSFNQTFTSNDPCNDNGRNIGIAVGALAGAIIGNQVKHSDSSRILGALAGAAVGGLIGADIDRRQCELFKIAKKNNLDLKSDKITVAQVTDPGQIQNVAEADRSRALGLKVTLNDNGHQFRSGSDELTPEALAYFGQIADQYSYEVQKKRLTPNADKEDIAAVESLKGKRILLIGHTDDTGSSTLNADLSERRAKAVAKAFRDHGISDERLFFQGAGETLPIADNRTDVGRARNRRVEIIDLADDDSLHAYLGHRRPTLAYYRPAQDAQPTTTQQPVPSYRHPAESNKKKAGSSKAKSESGSEPIITAQPTTNNAVSQGGEGSNKRANIVNVGQEAIASKINNSGIDFGGAPAATSGSRVDIGNVQENQSGFSVISTAHADEPLVGSCWQDRPRVSHGVKSLKTGRDYATDDYMPGLYGTSWTDSVNGNLVALTHVAVLRDGGLPATKPTLLVYRDYNPKTQTAPAIKDTPEVNVYRGDKGILYRVFASAPMRCIDVIIPYSTNTVAPNSRIYYDRAQTLYVANFNPKIAK